MFTGLIERVGTIAGVEPLGEGRRLVVEADEAKDLTRGESVAVDGCCLTVVGTGVDRFTVEAVRETCRRTIVGEYSPGRTVHLERALRVGDRLGGHLVQGHIDAVGTVRSIERHGENRYIDLALPGPDRSLVADRASIAVNGVSLTVLATTGDGVRLSIVPHTWSVTTMPGWVVGDHVNVEYDVIAHYVNRIMELR